MFNFNARNYTKQAAFALWMLLFAASASAYTITRVEADFDQDTDEWTQFGTWSNGNGADVADLNGDKYGAVWTSYGWSSIGRNVNTGSKYQACKSSAVLELGGSSALNYWEVIDTATWTYLAPAAHPDLPNDPLMETGVFTPKAKNIYLRYIRVKDANAEVSFGRVDDGLLVCFKR